MYLLDYSQLIAKLVYSPRSWTLLSAWQLSLASPCQWNMLLLGNRCTLKLASVPTKVKLNWTRILWRVFGLSAWHCQNTLKFLICNNEEDILRSEVESIFKQLRRTSIFSLCKYRIKSRGKSVPFNWHTGREIAELEKDPGFCCCSNGTASPLEGSNLLDIC